MISLDRQIKEQFRQVIADNLPKKGNIQVVDELTMDLPNEFPYFTYYLYDEGKQVMFNQINDEKLEVGIQIKAVSNNQEEAGQMARFLRNVFRSKGVLYNLINENISITAVDFLPNVNLPIEESYLFEKGIDIRAVVKNNYHDETLVLPKNSIQKINNEE